MVTPVNGSDYLSCGCLKFCIQVEEELYYLCRENKGADQLCNLFSHMQKSGFLMMQLIFSSPEPLGSQGELIGWP